MRKLFPVIAAAALALSISAGGCAKEKPPPPPPPAKEAVAGAGAEKKAAPKPRPKLFTGTIEELDEAAGTVTLKGPKGGERRFHAGKKEKDQLDGLEIGDKVIVKHVDNIVLSIVKPRTSRYALPWDENEVL
jgi:hypothetical protein